MTPLRARYIAYLELKGYAAKTRRNYLDPIIHFSRWLKRSPDTLTKDDIQRYLLYRKRDRNLAIRTLNIHIYALKSFCSFILPHGFMRIRHFGIFANRGRSKRMRHCREMLGVTATILTEKLPWWEVIRKRTGKNPLQCPVCKNGLLRLITIMYPKKRWGAMTMTI